MHWPPNDATLREIVASQSYSEIARAYGVSKDTVYRRAQKLGRGDDAPDVAEWQTRRDAATREVVRDASRAERMAEVFDWLRPVEMPAPLAPTKPRVAGTDRTLIAGDFHFPMQDDAACEVFLQAVAALRPRRVILNGDTVDLLAVSRYAKEARASKGLSWPLRDEVTAFHAFLHRLHSIGDAWGIEVVETNANHSGDGPASRWWRYLNEQCGHLLSHARAEELLSYQTWFYPTWSTIQLVDSFTLADDLLVLHGDLSRAQAGYSARGHATKWQASLIHNHTHRAGFSPHRLPAIPGVREEGIVRAYENGCMCRLEASYGSALNWQQSFAIVTHHPAGGARYGVEQVIVHRGRAVVGALGGELAA